MPLLDPCIPALPVARISSDALATLVFYLLEHLAYNVPSTSLVGKSPPVFFLKDLTSKDFQL